MERVTHTFGPCCDEDCRILILGTMPSPKSREQGFYYGHPQNVFWKTLAQILSVPEPEPTPEARRAFALAHRIALWDVLHSCEIEGAEDSSIRNEEPNDLSLLFSVAPRIHTIFTTGKKALSLYQRHGDEMYKNCGARQKQEAVYLPSTSPANRALQKTALYMELWQQVREALNRTDRR